ncbi:tripartite tricarboxylate transporter TctB family protein [Mumia zhuanghuii]|uniref:Tripartite tricarboxylate transporter TctB family protein n=2 Tax=Mumia TaxID=1546255 RepID=A0ABW1QIB7_9ACTN|nr:MULTISPECIES: tripartite tricarboxylate transporter TctB family protein [Mumia]KAA1418275.1 tripartite tricarboxylate transporter TctB family protein [Mumia zhuanghuii]
MTEPAREALTPEELAAEWEESKPPAAGPVANLIAAGAVIAFGVAGILMSLSLGAGSLGEPDAGSWPLVVSATLTILGIALAVRAGSTHDAEQFGRSSLTVLAALATMVPFALVVGVIGFEIPAALLAFVWLRFLGRESWRVSIVGSVLMVVVFYLIFVLALGVSIPHLF